MEFKSGLLRAFPVRFRPVQCRYQRVVIGLDKVSTCGNLPHIVLKLKSLKVPTSAQISIWGGGGGVFWNWKVLKCQDLPKFQFFLGGVFWNWKFKVPRSAQISIFGGGRGRGEGGRGRGRGEGGRGEGGRGVFWNWKVKVPRSLTIFIWGGVFWNCISE